MALSNSAKSRDMRSTSRTITSLLATVGTLFAVSAMIGAPVAQACSGPDVVWLNGACTEPPPVDSGGPPPAPKLTTVNGPAGSSTTHIVNGKPQR